MKGIVASTIGFISKTFPALYSTFYLDYLKQYSSSYDVNKTQLRALVFVNNNGPISMTDLCAKLNIEKGSLTSMVDDLTDKGYVVREKDASDRRKYLITITENGKNVALDFMGKLSDSLEEKLFKLTEEEQSKYMEAIGTLQTILNKENLG